MHNKLIISHMGKQESEPSRRTKRLLRQIDRGLARIASDPSYREHMNDAVKQRLQELNSIERLPQLKPETTPIVPELMDTMATILTEHVIDGSLNPAGLKKKLSEPDAVSSLMEEATARLLQKPREIRIDNN